MVRQVLLAKCMDGGCTASLALSAVGHCVVAESSRMLFKDLMTSAQLHSIYEFAVESVE